VDGTRIAMPYLAKTLQHAAASGIDFKGLLEGVGLTELDLGDSARHVSFETYAAVVTRAMLAMDDEGLGHYARRIPFGSWSMMCYAATNSRTLGEALQRYCRFFLLLDAGVAPSLAVSGNLATVRLVQTPTGCAMNRFLAERALLHCHRFGNWLIQCDIPIVSVSFRHARPASAPYRSMFATHDVRFEQAHDEFRFSASLLDSPVERNRQALDDLLRQPVLSLLTLRSEQRSWSSLVRKEINRDLPRVVTQSQIASRLGLHPQALRRRLAAEGATFKQLVDDARKGHALHLLQAPSASVEAVAYSAGFSDTSAFVRAFRRWTGFTPHAYRRLGPRAEMADPAIAADRDGG